MTGLTGRRGYRSPGDGKRFPIANPGQLQSILKEAAPILKGAASSRSTEQTPHVRTLGYGTVVQLLSKQRGHMQYSLARRLWELLPSDIWLRVEQALWSPDVFRRRREYVDALAAELARLRLTTPASIEWFSYETDQACAELTVIGRVALPFADKQKRRGVGKGRIELAHRRVWTHVHAFPDVQRIRAQNLTTLTHALYRAEEVCIDAEFAAYGLMFGNSENLEPATEREACAASSKWPAASEELMAQLRASGTYGASVGGVANQEDGADPPDREWSGVTAKP